MGSGPAIQACPGCAAGDLAGHLAQGRDGVPNAGTGTGTILLSLPGVHCAGCISTVERALGAVAGVRSARVNLTLRRAAVEAGPDTTAAELIAAAEAAGYEAWELDGAALAGAGDDPAGRALLMRLAVAGFAMMNVMLLSVAVWSGAVDATRDLFHWISGAIALPAIAFSAQPFFANAWTALRRARLNMDVPISLAIVLAAALSVYETSQSGADAYFDAALSLTFFLLGGRYLDHRTRTIARSAAQELTALEVPRATAADGRVAAVADFAPGDRVLVAPGARVPLDGIVETGASETDRSFLTGESLPVAVEPGAAVAAGEINLTGPLTIRVTARAADSALRRMTDLVAMAETARNRYTSLADRAARIYAPLVHLLAAAAFAGWFVATGDVRLSLNVAVAVLIITCPCALGLAVPAVTTAASGRLYREGVLIKSATALERLAEVDTVVFDKTGTLTQGRPRARDIDAHGPRVLAIAAGLAAGSSHPLAAALAEAIAARGIAPLALTDLHEVPGHGIEGRLEGTPLRLGRAEWVGAEAGAVDATATWLRIGTEAPIAFTFADALRPGAEDTVRALRAAGLDVVLLSGDTAAAVADVAARTGIDAWEAGMLPADKAARIGAMAGSGRRVLMVGDGLNDTAALAAAHASISPASGLDAARVVADMVLVGHALGPVATALRTARRARRRIVENFTIAALYNAVAIPVALAGLASPLAAALAMSASSITVSLNALRLTRR